MRTLSNSIAIKTVATKRRAHIHIKFLKLKLLTFQLMLQIVSMLGWNSVTASDIVTYVQGNRVHENPKAVWTGIIKSIYHPLTLYCMRKLLSPEISLIAQSVLNFDSRQSKPLCFPRCMPKYIAELYNTVSLILSSQDGFHLGSFNKIGRGVVFT